MGTIDMTRGRVAGELTRDHAPEATPGATIDDVRSYWDRRPCNIRHSLQPVGTQAYFDEVEARKYFVEPHIPGFAEHQKWAGRKVLEIGCGIGTDATNFARAGADYTGVDLSTESLALTRKRFEVFGLNGKLLQCDAERLTQVVPPGPYDLVYSFGVIHHTPDPGAVVAQVRKLIAPDGEFRLMVYAKNSWKNIMIEGGMDQPEAQSGCPIAFTYTVEEAAALLKGFRIVEARQEHIFPYVVEKYVKFEYEPQPWFKAMPEGMFAALEKALGWHLCIRAVPV